MTITDKERRVLLDFQGANYDLWSEAVDQVLSGDEVEEFDAKLEVEGPVILTKSEESAVYELFVRGPDILEECMNTYLDNSELTSFKQKFGLPLEQV